eukprot:TRINITY_DN49209_c0_g1_i1.p1 TRINITY_DN49209_c0_g1~~TRINITY_DN49209_c0_g1_i1.p1  ORF type:complete len:708 (-),score=168.42 TRINITY_DN49209_c0_g1_i1:271-2394(-)
MAVRGVQRLCFTKSADEIRRGLETLVKSYEANIDKLVAAASPLIARGGSDEKELFKATFGRLADADGHAALASAELTLPALVSGDAATRAASSEAKKQLQNMWSRAYARCDVFDCLKAAERGAKSAEEERLVKLVLAKFRQAGVSLKTEEARSTVTKLDARCSALAFEIEQNINEDCLTVPLTEAELEGCGADFVQSLPTNGSQAVRLCSVKAPVMVPIMKRAERPEARRKMMEASQKRCIEANGKLLDELLEKRHAAAVALGFKNHAERMLSAKMALTPEKAEAFCLEMLGKLEPLRKSDMDRLLARKMKDAGSRKRKEPGASPAGLSSDSDDIVQPWDVMFFSDLLKQEELHFDDEKVKEFFPLVPTIEKMLAVYADFLGLTFERAEQLPRWHEEVVAFEVKRDGKVVGHLYLDQFPRDGKFGHQMIVPLAPSFVDSVSGERCVPACVNISNLPRPQGDKPALLRWGEMQTLFHELGHVMHCLCTTTRFSLLSWAWPMVPWPGGVEQDFLEVPSMALEKFACEPALLSKVAGHYSKGPDAPALSADTFDKIKALEKWLVGASQSKYFAMALFDLKAHASAPPYDFDGSKGLSAQQLYANILTKYTGLPSIPNTHPCASWYHLVIGYDAGYYGYGWSDVYAADVFASMMSSPKGPLSSETGGKFRDEILGPCATRAGSDMMRSFLGREPTSDAWCERMGIAVRSSM